MYIYFLLVRLSILGQSTIKNDWENLTVFSVNAMKPHSLIVPFESLESAKTYNFSNTPYY
jgi:hypothetical protein